MDILISSSQRMENERLELENLNLETELNMTESKLNDVWDRKLELEKDVIDLKKKNKRCEQRVQRINSSFNEKLGNLKDKLEYMNGEFLPTYEELKDVVEEHTNVSDYDYQEKSFTCIDFSTKMVSQLDENHINSCVTSVTYNNYSSSHHLVSVNTTDGIVYLEPQSGKFMEDFGVGTDFCKVINEPSCTKKIEKVSSCYESNSIY